MRVLIVEDEQSIADTIVYLLDLYFPQLKDVVLARNIQEATKAFNESDIDILFLDVKLGKETSFDFLNQVDALTTTKIFISGHEKFIKASLKQNTVDFLLKPIDTAEFKSTVERAIDQVKKLKGPEKSFAELQEAKITVADLESIHLIKLSEITHLEASGPYTDIYLESGDKLTFSKHLKDFENRLAATGFFRVHKSFMVNGAKVRSILKRDGHQVMLSNGMSAPLSSRRKEEFFEFLKANFEV